VSKPLIRDQARALLGKQVRVVLGRESDGQPAFITGRLLAFGDDGSFEVREDTGFVNYCWPLLEIEEAG
jgi:hypothetical protein